MTAPRKRAHSITVRLSPAEKDLLAAVAADLSLDKSATMRCALHLLARQQQPLPRHGLFVTPQAPYLHFSIQLRGERDGDG